MTRSEYLNTIEGQLSQRLKRRMRILYLEINEEPKSKNSITKQEKISFRKTVKKILQQQNRKAYRGDVILQMDFYTTQNNPPSIHTLTKNYLDLLHKAIPEIDDNSRILFNDDSQIKILITNYHLNQYGHNRSCIRIQSYSLGNFKKDIELADRIINNDFSDADNRIHSKFEDRYYKDNLANYEEYHFELNTLEKLGNSNDPKYYDIQRQYLIQKIQEGYLKQNQIKINDLISILDARYKNSIDLTNKSLNKLYALMDKMIFISSDFLELGELPTKAGESKIFKKNIRKLFINFKSEFNRIFPLLQPVKVFMVIIPPNDVVIDLDNLAMKIAPIVTEILQPPSSFKVLYFDKNLNPHFKRQTQISQRFPDYSISGFQIIQVPRKEEDPANGKIKIVLTDGNNNYNNVWNLVNRLIGVWEDVN